LGDFNGDHATDLLWQRTTDQELMIWDINTEVSAMNMSAISARMQLVGNGDFNADGTTNCCWHAPPTDL